MVSNLNVSHGEMSHFVSFSLFEFTLFIQLGNLDFKSHENTLIYFDKKDMVSNLNMPQGKITFFVSFPLLGFTLVTKLRNFDFGSHFKIL